MRELRVDVSGVRARAARALPDGTSCHQWCHWQ